MNMNASKATQLQNELSQFIGTGQYYRMLPTLVVTDGVKYLMDAADCYWLTQMYGLHLVGIVFNEHAFTVLKLTRKKQRALVRIEDGNGGLLVEQKIDYTDFVLDSITLYACWGGEHWVCMLPSEY
jgi:hypothetical protein